MSMCPKYGSIKEWFKTTPFLVEDTSDALVATVGGTAVAVGDDTLVSGSLGSTTRETAHVTISKGYADFWAVAEDADNDATAVADAFVDTIGADLVIIFANHGVSNDGNTASAFMKIEYLAFDWKAFDFAGGTIGISVSIPSYPTELTSDIDGNTAQVDASATAFGDNSLALTITNALSVESQFSLIEGTAWSGIA